MSDAITKIIEDLSAPLDKKYVTTREKSGTKLAYVEGWHVIAEANRIFGPLNWSRETISCREVSRDKNAKGNHVIGYEAKVRVTVHVTGEGFVQQVVREGTGTGSGIARDIYDAIEGAAKEAETDAMKRALMTFGWCMGLALYDKNREHVAENAASATDAEDERDATDANRAQWAAWAQKAVRSIQAAPDDVALAALLTPGFQKNLANARDAYPEMHKMVQGAIDDKKRELGGTA